ncbi:MAG TPA: hypothetical protein VGI81_29165 [Tepidisphaeraceae bacterium]|jgi:hypothetical protein
MLTAPRITEEVDGFRRRVEDLYAKVQRWITARRPDAEFHRTQVELSEEATGVYQLDSLDVALPGLPSLRFVPRGIFMVGAHGRVDVRSRLGREVLVWLEAGEPSLATSEAAGDDAERIISRPIFRDVAEGWAWTDSKRGRVLPLAPEVLWDLVLEPLTR